VTLITGDHAVTASAIGRMFAIIRGQSKALTGRELETMSDEDLFTKAQEVSIFAKVSHSKVIRRH
jgi:Ca2+-transporting ATPase